MGRIRYSGSPVVLASTNTTTEMMASATSDWSSRAPMNWSTRPGAGYLPEASWSMKRSYMTVPGFHLPSVLEVEPRHRHVRPLHRPARLGQIARAGPRAPVHRRPAAAVTGRARHHLGGGLRAGQENRRTAAPDP